MRAIAIAAGLMLSACASAQGVQQTKLPDPLEAGWEGEKVCEVLQDNEAVRVLRCTFPPGVGHEKHFHAPHVGYALKGGSSGSLHENYRGTRDQIRSKAAATAMKSMISILEKES